MKEISLYDALKIYFETHDDSPMPDIVEWILKYREEHYCYIPYDRDEIEYTFFTSDEEFYWDKMKNIVRKQESVICPCCGLKYFKYPITDMFYKIKSYENKN